jgi:hypothetical protein
VQWQSCTGVSSCWLVILIGAGSSEVWEHSRLGRKWGSLSSASRSLRAHKVGAGRSVAIVPLEWARMYRKAPGKRTGRMQAGRAQQATWAQATRSRGETSAGPTQAGRAALCAVGRRHWGAVGGYCMQGWGGRAAP